VEGLVTVFMHALDARARLALTAHGTREPPASRRYTMQFRHGLEKLDAAKSHLRDPQSANDVSPSAVVRALDGPAADRAHAARHVVGNTRLASSTQPLALRDVRHAIAFLVYGKVARITEQDHVNVGALVITAYCTHGVVVRQNGRSGCQSTRADYVLS